MRSAASLLLALLLALAVGCGGGREDKTPPVLESLTPDPNATLTATAVATGTIATTTASATPTASPEPVTLTYSGTIERDGAPLAEGAPVEIRAGAASCGTGAIALVDGASTYEVDVASDCGGKVARELYVDGALAGKVSAAGGEQDFALTTSTATPGLSATPASHVVSDELWSEAFCDGIAVWLGDIGALGEGLQDEPTPTEPEAQRQLMVAFFDDVLVSTDTFVATVRESGIPETADGEAIATAFVRGLDQVRTILRDSREAAAQLPVDDPEQFKTAVQALVATLDEGSAEINAVFKQVDEDYDTSALSAAFVETPACVEIFGTGNPFAA